MANDVKTELKKQISDIETKGALRSKYETTTLENLKVKLKAVDKAKRSKG